MVFYSMKLMKVNKGKGNSKCQGNADVKPVHGTLQHSSIKYALLFMYMQILLV